MSAKSFGEERRLFARFTFREAPLVVTPKRIGLLEDMSLGGASFQYFDKGQGCLDGSAFEIVLPFGHIQVKAEQYEVVATTPQEPPASSEGQARVRRYHLRFVDLTSADLQNMWQMIKKHCARPWDAPIFIQHPLLPPPMVSHLAV